MIIFPTSDFCHLTSESKIYIAGHTGMVGSAIVRRLKTKGYKNLVFTPFPEYDLTNQQVVFDYFKKEQPDYVINAAAKVGGILANNIYRGQFIYENMMIQNNVIHSAHESKVKKLLFLGSSCIYPKYALQPMKEEYLLTGKLEQTNEPYAIAKISGITMCENYYRQYGDNFISVMPTNLYGENDNFDLKTSHVLPALIRKIHLGKCLEENNWDNIKSDLNKNPIDGINGSNTQDEILQILNKHGISIKTEDPTSNLRHLTSNLRSLVSISLWGSGKPKREFLYVDDVANACVFLLENVDAAMLYDEMKISHINIGCGEDMTIAELSEIIARIVGYNGKIKYDASKPDGTPRKLLDISRLKGLGWKPSISLEEGIKLAYDWYKKNEYKSPIL